MIRVAAPDLSPLGTWTLADFGAASGLTYAAANRRWRPTWQLPFSLRADQHPGGTNWWILHIHYRVTFAPAARAGTDAIFGAMTNQVACAYIRFEVPSQRTILVRSTSLIGGYRQTRVRAGATFEGHFTNYFATAGVEPGRRNLLQFVLSQARPAVVARLVVLPDSFVEHTTAGPGLVSVTATAPGRVRERDGVTLRVRVANAGGTPARNVVVSVHALGERVRYGTRHVFAAGTLAAARAKEYVVRIRPSRKGPLTLAVDAVAAANHVGRVLTIDVR